MRAAFSTRTGGAALALGLALAACGPDLDRQAGSLQVTVRSIPVGTDQVRIEITGDAVEPYAVGLPVSGAELVHDVGSVPAGEVRVTAVASARGVVEAQRARGVVISADVRNELVLDFLAPPDEVRSGPISLSAAVSSEDVDLGVIARTAVAGAAWTSFLSQAESELGAPPARFSLRSVEVRLLGGSELIEELDDLWDDAVTVSLVSSAEDRIVVASGVLPEDVLTYDVPLAAGAGQLGILTEGLLAGTVDLEVTGPSAQGAEESFTAQLQITLAMTALPE